MTAPAAEDLLGNGLLAILRDEDRRRLAPHMVIADLEAKDTLQKAGEDVVQTWFPCGAAMASFCVWVEESGSNVEVALVGREG